MSPSRRATRTTGSDSGVVRGDRGAYAMAHPEDLPPRLRQRRAVTLLLLTLFIPGSAQLVAGNQRVGHVAFRAWVALLGVLAVTSLVFLVDRAFVLNLVARFPVLTVLAWSLVALAVAWAALFLDTLRLARIRLVPTATRRWLAALTCALIVLTSGTLAFGARNVLAGRDAVQAMAGENIAKRPSAGRYNVLLLGSDSGADRAGTRPDTIMLASVNSATGRSALFAFARDTENIEFRKGSVMATLMPQGWNCGDRCLLNGLYQWAAQNASRFPPDTKNPGVLAMTEAVEALSGLDIQYYVLVDLKGFQRLVDAVGGLDVHVGKRTPIGGGTSPISGWIEPGEQHLDGYHALWYARSREGSSNYERMTRQRCVMTAMLHRLNPQTVYLRFQDLVGVAGSELRTSIPYSEFGTFADLALKARGHRIASVNFVPPTIKPWDYDPGVIRDKVVQAVARSETDAAPRPAPRDGSARPTTDGPQTGSTGEAEQPPPGGLTEDLTSVCTAR